MDNHRNQQLAMRHRYPGVRPFETEDSDLFYGRDADRDELLRLIFQEKLVVLFGKSGYGKSSLINASIIPELEKSDGIQAFNIRFGTNTPDQPLTAILLSHIQKDKRLSINPDMEFLDDLYPEKTLWFFAKKYQQKDSQWVFFFDQFEGYLQQPVHQRRKFEQELSELIYTGIPQLILDRLDHYPKEDKTSLLKLLVQPLDIRVVISIRGDKVSELDSMKYRLPAILQKRFELKALGREQARDAIRKPARLNEPAFSSPPYEYTDEALEEMMSGLAGPAGGIEAFQLQFLCDFIDKQVAAGRIPDRDGDGLPDVQVQDIPDFEQVFSQYYEDRLSSLPENLRIAARRIIEEELLFENELTGEAKRISLDQDVLLQRAAPYGATLDLLHRLQSSFLLRREANLLSGYSYEISHDTLLMPIMKARRERMQAERQAMAEEQRTLAEDRAMAAEKEAKREMARRRKATILAIVAGCLFLISVTIGGIAIKERKNAELAKKKAEAERNSAELAKKKALIATKEAIIARMDADSQKHRALEASVKAILEQKKADSAKSKAVEALEKAFNAEADKVLSEVDNILQRANKLQERYPDIYMELNKEAKSILSKYPDNPRLRKKLLEIR